MDVLAVDRGVHEAAAAASARRRRDSIAPAAPSAWPIIDLVEVIGGSSPGPRPSARRPRARPRCGSAPVAVRWPLIASISRGVDAGVGERRPDAAAHALRVRRGHAAAAAVAAAVDARRPAPRRGCARRASRALSRLSSMQHARARAGHEAAGARAHRPRGPLGLVVEAARRARASRRSRPRCSGSPPSRRRTACARRGPARMRSAPSTIASVPVLHALELVVTWLPSASRPRDARRDAARHHLLDRRAAEAAHLARVGRAGPPSRRSCPCRRCRCRAPRPRPSRRASSPAVGPREAGVLPGLDRRERARSGGSRSSRAAAPRRSSVSASASTPCGTPATVAAEAELGELRHAAQARASRAQRRVEVGDADRRSARSRRARHDDAPRSSRSPPCPASGARARPTRAVLAAHLDLDAQLRAPEEDLARRRSSRASPGRTTPVNSTFASVKNGQRSCAASASGARARSR